MKKIIPLLLCLGGVVGFAQKPMPVNPLTIELPAENEQWRMNGGMRIAEKTGYPAALYGIAFRAAAATPEAMAREYLTTNAGLLGLTPAAIASLRLHAVRAGEAGTVVRLRQYYQNLPVTGNAEITVHIGPGNIVDYVQNGFVYAIALANTTPAITPAAARQAAFNHLGIAGNIPDVQNTLKVLRNTGHDYLVYHLVIPLTQPLGEWDIFVNANTGSLLQVLDKAAYHHKKGKTRKPQNAGGRVSSPARVTVNGAGTVFDPDPLTTATAIYGGAYVDGSDANAAVLTAQLKTVTLPDITLTAGTYSLVGPYATIQDFEAPSKGLFTQASGTFNFDRNADAFEAVNTYYHIDAMMRYLNLTLGLSIMPYQYTGGVRFDPSGLSGADNSHYLSGSGRLAFGEGGVDDAEDADVIIHELGHGLHDWVTAGGLSQVNGLSEGTGDYIAGSYSRFKGYWTTAQPGYHYMFSWDGHNPFWSGRVLNYGAVYPGGLTGSIHTDGQIWATFNMKIWDDIGRQKADKIFWSGLAMTNSSTNQNDAANAVYQAANALGYTNAERLAIHTRYTAAGYTLPTFVLPVTWVSFGADKQGNDAVIRWTTAAETGSRSFSVERSANGIQFNEIGMLPAAGGSGNHDYGFTDANAAALQAKLYYRIKETGVNGAVTYSRVATVQFGKKAALEIFPNPAHDQVTVNTKLQSGELYINNAAGKTVKQQRFNNTGGQFTLSLSGLAEGVYWVKLVAADGTVQQAKLLKE